MKNIKKDFINYYRYLNIENNNVIFFIKNKKIHKQEDIVQINEFF